MNNEMVHVGMDVHQGKLVWCAANTDGEVAVAGFSPRRWRRCGTNRPSTPPAGAGLRKWVNLSTSLH